MDRKKFFIFLSTLFILEWVLLAFNVNNRADWALENALVIFFIYPIVIFYRKDYLSKTSFALIYIFLTFHIIGAHYTYSLVPYNTWFAQVTGTALNSLLHWERNNYDRILHFMCGLLVFLPLYEIFKGTTILRGGLLVIFSLLVLFCATSIYELIEWGAAVVFGGDLGLAYVGAQGDPWDAQKDQACAAVGGLLSAAITKRLRT